MTHLEERSATRVKALKYRVEKGQITVEAAIEKLDNLNGKGLLTAKDFDETFDYLDELLNTEIEPVEETVEENASEENIESEE